ncbi:hypothetical protein Tco_0366706 [Tanacetum coccineum]
MAEHRQTVVSYYLSAYSHDNRISCLRIGVEMRDGYIQISDMSKEVLESIENLRQMQVDDMEKASRLALMAREIQDKIKREWYMLEWGAAFLSCCQALATLMSAGSTGSFTKKARNPVDHVDLQFLVEVIHVF